MVPFRLYVKRIGLQWGLLSKFDSNDGYSFMPRTLRMLGPLRNTYDTGSETRAALLAAGRLTKVDEG